MFPTGQPPYPPMGAFPGFQQTAGPQMMRSMAPLANAGSRGFGGLPGLLGKGGWVPALLGFSGMRVSDLCPGQVSLEAGAWAVKH